MRLSFERGKDPLVAMDIGHIQDVEKWLGIYGIEPMKIDAEGEGVNRVFFVEVDGDVVFDSFTLDDVKKIPENIKFRNVTGRFILGNNK